ncbi:alanine racemase [Snodgrassella alvi]|jgi:alanine racemase|uniref:Alanine racemase n=1 Tax=Snodgrassella alvi TaxID=1196083 RepID=A0A2N9XEH0_9NEIS|nr:MULTISPECIES: alanine racemase [Snodgrassella]PIT07381.1 alanine racemase [Snodgrassella communis]PIT46008.1 alanine racemase [Snodgrassella alvi]
MRPLVAHIRLNHLRDNFLALKQMHGGGKMLAVVKANAYGHGAVRCAQALADMADGFAVACISEAVQLREAGIQLPIVMLEGVFAAEEYALADRYQLWPVVGNLWQLETLLAHDWQKPVTVWLKMDSGMHRTGFFPHDYAPAYQALAQSDKVADVVKITHFACADEPMKTMTAEQIHAFEMVCANLPGEVSLANSAAMMAYPQTQCGWGRAGLALYGISPMGGTDSRFKPVMRLVSKVFGERVLQMGEPIGYGASFVTNRSTRVGLVACGYADGYPRRAATGTPVAINGVRSNVLGRVSMDMMTVQLDDHRQSLGSEVELWGDVVNVNEVAAAAGTIAYELLCNVKRAEMVYE